MNYQEKINIVKVNTNIKMQWHIVLTLLILGVVLSIYSIYSAFTTVELPIGTTVPLLVFFTLLPLGALFLLQLWILWGVYRLEGWVTMWLWIAMVLALLGFDFIGLVVSLVILILYKKILNTIKNYSSVQNQTVEGHVNIYDVKDDKLKNYFFFIVIILIIISFGYFVFSQTLNVDEEINYSDDKLQGITDMENENSNDVKMEEMANEENYIDNEITTKENKDVIEFDEGIFSGHIIKYDKGLITYHFDEYFDYFEAYFFGNWALPNFVVRIINQQGEDITKTNINDKGKFYFELPEGEYWYSTFPTEQLGYIVIEKGEVYNTDIPVTDTIYSEMPRRKFDSFCENFNEEQCVTNKDRCIGFYEVEYCKQESGTVIKCLEYTPQFEFCRDL